MSKRQTDLVSTMRRLFASWWKRSAHMLGGENVPESLVKADCVLAYKAGFVAGLKQAKKLENESF